MEFMQLHKWHGIENASNYLKKKKDFEICFVKNMFMEVGFYLVSPIYK